MASVLGNCIHPDLDVLNVVDTPLGFTRIARIIEAGQLEGGAPIGRAAGLVCSKVQPCEGNDPETELATNHISLQESPARGS